MDGIEDAAGVPRVVGWVTGTSWTACVDAVRAHAADDADVVLLYVAAPDHAPGGALLQAAAERLGRTCELVERTAAEPAPGGAATGDGPDRHREERLGAAVGRVVAGAAEGADLLVMVRDGDRDRLGPESLGPAGRHALDHAPCPVLLLWPGAAPTPHGR